MFVPLHKKKLAVIDGLLVIITALGQKNIAIGRKINRREDKKKGEEPGGRQRASGMREQTEAGKPTVGSDPDGEMAGNYKSGAGQVAVSIAQRVKESPAKFPTITISKTT